MGYLSIAHQSGPIFAAHYLNLKLKSVESPSVAILTPCYTLPGRTHMHIQNLTIRTLDCSPNLSNDPKYMTETESFLEDPRIWAIENFDRDKSFHYSHFADNNDGQSKNILVYAKRKA